MTEAPSSHDRCNDYTDATLWRGPVHVGDRCPQSDYVIPAGSSAGPDGLRPQHLEDLKNCQERGSDLLTALTGFVNIALLGHCPREVAPIFFGGRLIALEKKSGGTRPIAIGLTLRRLASKCANSFGVERLKSSFSPRQLGVGIPGGCDTAVHCASRFSAVLASKTCDGKARLRQCFQQSPSP